MVGTSWHEGYLFGRLPASMNNPIKTSVLISLHLNVMLLLEIHELADDIKEKLNREAILNALKEFQNHVLTFMRAIRQKMRIRGCISKQITFVMIQTSSLLLFL